MPAVKEIELPETAEPGVEPRELHFDVFTQPTRRIEVFSRSRAPLDFTFSTSKAWIHAARVPAGLSISIDWGQAPKGQTDAFITVGAMPVNLTVFNPEVRPANAFVESDGCVSIEAEHYTAKHDAGPLKWELIPDYGRTLSAMTITSATAASVTPPVNSPSLEYRMYLFTDGKAEVETILGPSLNFVPGRGLRYAVSFDDGQPQIVDALEHNTQRDWETSVKDAVRKVKSTHTIAAPGYHTLKIWMVDPGVVLEKLVVNLGGVKPSYLGAPESYRN